MVYAPLMLFFDGALKQLSYRFGMLKHATTPIHTLMWNTKRSSMRRKVERWSTLRASDRMPHDVVIDDLSVTGFRMSGAENLAANDPIRVGLAGIGAREAVVVWTQGEVAGCRFIDAITPAQMDLTIGANTVVDGPFNPPMAQDIVSLTRDDAPPGHKAAFIILSAITAWAGFIVIGYVIFALVR